MSVAPLVEPVEADFSSTSHRRPPMRPGEAYQFGSVYVYRWRSGRRYTVRTSSTHVNDLTSWFDVWSWIVTKGDTSQKEPSP